MILKKYKLYTLLTVLFLLIFSAGVNAREEFEYKSVSIAPGSEIGIYFPRLKTIINEVKNEIDFQARNFRKTQYRAAQEEVTRAEESLANAEIFYSYNQKDRAESSLNTAISYLKNAQLNLIPSRAVELRGMYIDADSIPRTKKEITELIRTLKKSNFNIIYPEVFRRGYTIVPTPFTDIDPAFKNVNFDVLEYITQEANYHNIEVHPWIWTFRVKSPKFGNPVLGKYPHLAATGKNEVREPLFLSAAAPEARTFVTRLLGYISGNYRIEGLLLDYIRYDETINDDDISKRYFADYYFNKYGEYPPEQIRQDNPIFIEWQLWRERQVTTAVEGIRKELDKVKPGMKIGVSVFRSAYEGRLTKMQDWRLWADNQIVDYVSPMLYTDKPEDLDMWLNWETDNKTRNDYLYPGLGAHRFITTESLFKQINLLHKRNIPGLNIFAMVHVNNGILEDLSRGAFRKNAILPHKNISSSVKTILTDLKTWVYNMSKQENRIPNDEAAKIISRIDSINGSISYETPGNFNNMRDIGIKLIEMRKYVDSFTFDNKLPAGFLFEINNELDYAMSLLKVQMRLVMNENKSFSQTMPPLPRLAETKELPTAHIFKVTVPPVLDGMLEDDFWGGIQPLRRFYWHNGITGAMTETVVKLAYGTDNLYVSFENFEPNIEKVSRVSNTRDSWDIFADDAVELFLQVPGRSDYYHFVVNLNNNKFDEKVNRVEWNSSWQSAVNRYADKWVAEIAIPFKDINYQANEGYSIKANFLRIRSQEVNPNSAWSPTYGTSHTPSRFGKIVFN